MDFPVRKENWRAQTIVLIQRMTCFLSLQFFAVPYKNLVRKLKLKFETFEIWNLSHLLSAINMGLTSYSAEHVTSEYMKGNPKQPFNNVFSSGFSELIENHASV